VLDVKDLQVCFEQQGRLCHAVNGVDLQVAPGECLGIVGESGSGKSVSCYALGKLLPEARITAARMQFMGRDLLAMSPRQLRREILGKHIGYIFQDPMSALTPWMSVGKQIEESLLLHQKNLSAKQRKQLCLDTMQLVGIGEPQLRYDDYPMHFSGGMRQRVLIAAALVNRPQLLIADEPTTALDVRIQRQILELLAELQQQFKLGMLLISHDLKVVAAVASRVQVMYAGQVVEMAEAGRLLQHPRHAYTKALLGSLPALGKARLLGIAGQAPQLEQAPQGCSFAARNSFAKRYPCAVEGRLQLVELEQGHWAQNCPGCLSSELG